MANESRNAPPRGDAAHANEVIDGGLRLYSQGDLVRALDEWRRALEIDPGNRRANDYIKYVEQHFEILDERFRAARERRASDAPASAGSFDDDEDADAYDSIEVEEGREQTPPPARAETNMGGWQSRIVQRAVAATTPTASPYSSLATPSADAAVADAAVADAAVADAAVADAAVADAAVVPTPPTPAPTSDLLESVDEGWSLDGMEDFVSAAAGAQAPDATEPMTGTGGLDDLSDLGTDDPMLDLPTGELTLPSLKQTSASALLPEARAGLDLSDFDPAPTGTGGDPAPTVTGGDPPATRSARDSAADEEQTIDRRETPWPIPATDMDMSGSGANRRPPTEDPDIGASAVKVDDGLLSFDDQTNERPTLSAMSRANEVDPDADRATTQLYSRHLPREPRTLSHEAVAAEISAELDEAVTVDPGNGEVAIRERMKWLLERARRDSQAGQHAAAAVALDLALSEHSDSAVAQKIIHTNRELVYEVYRNYLGDLSLVPYLSQPMEKMPIQELDHRAAFLLSRVDGVLTLEDILDVSGMARLEAYRHLCRLLMRGLLAVR